MPLRIYLTSLNASHCLSATADSFLFLDTVYIYYKGELVYVFYCCSLCFVTAYIFMCALNGQCRKKFVIVDTFGGNGCMRRGGVEQYYPILYTRAGVRVQRVTV